jgi:hypothetical protein
VTENGKRRLADLGALGKIVGSVIAILVFLGGLGTCGWQALLWGQDRQSATEASETFATKEKLDDHAEGCDEKHVEILTELKEGRDAQKEVNTDFRTKIEKLRTEDNWMIKQMWKREGRPGARPPH